MIHIHEMNGYSRMGDLMKKKQVKTQAEEIITDPFGSYTGIPIDNCERPIQDADDL